MSTPVSLDTLGPLQAALYARLAGDQTLLDLLGHKGGPKPQNGIYDDVPQGALFPYIEIGEVIETPRNAHGEFGSEHLATLHVWGNKRGFKDAQAVVARVRALLDHQPLTVTGHNVWRVAHEQTLTLRDPNPELRHLPVRFRITTEQE